MVAHVERTLGDAVGVTFDTLSPADQTDLLLGKSTGDARTDTRVNACVTRYLKKAWRGRKHLTSALNKKLGREDTVWALRAHGDGECRVEPLRTRVARSA